MDKEAHVEGLCVTEVELVVNNIRKGQAVGTQSQKPVPLRRVNSMAVSAILILSGLSRARAGAVMAHELTHAYLAVSGIKKKSFASSRKLEGLPAGTQAFGLDLRTEEGLCELSAHLWLTKKAPVDPAAASPAALHDNKVAALHARRQTQVADPVYGGGFRDALAAYKREGGSLRRVLDHVAAHGRLSA